MIYKLNMKAFALIGSLFTVVFIQLSFVSNGQIISDFTLPNVKDGKPFILSSLKDPVGVVVIFVGNDCPFVESYQSRIEQIHDHFGSQGVLLILINSSTADSNTRANYGLLNKDYPFPYLIDLDKKVTKLFKARKTPEAFLLKPNGSQYHVVYKGAIDDNPQNENDVDFSYLSDAINRMLQRKSISRVSQHPTGCMIKG